MATADIVELMVNTRIPAGRIVDWIDQAILLTHLGVTGKKDADGATSRTKLLRYGIRTASSLIEVYDQFSRDPDENVRRDFLAILDAGNEKQRLRSLAVAMRSNNNLRLILNWRGLDLPAEPAACSPPQDPVRGEAGDGLAP
jgi:hypothetical protein